MKPRAVWSEDSSEEEMLRAIREAAEKTAMIFSGSTNTRKSNINSNKQFANNVSNNVKKKVSFKGLF
jgi:hypothetical protein